MTLFPVKNGVTWQRDVAPSGRFVGYTARRGDFLIGSVRRNERSGDKQLWDACNKFGFTVSIFTSLAKAMRRVELGWPGAPF